MSMCKRVMGWSAALVTAMALVGCGKSEPAAPPPGAPKESELLKPPAIDLGTPLQRPAQDNAPTTKK